MLIAASKSIISLRICRPLWVCIISPNHALSDGLGNAVMPRISNLNESRTLLRSRRWMLPFRCNSQSLDGRLGSKRRKEGVIVNHLSAPSGKTIYDHLRKTGTIKANDGHYSNQFTTVHCRQLDRSNLSGQVDIGLARISTSSHLYSVKPKAEHPARFLCMVSKKDCVDQGEQNLRGMFWAWSSMA
jgi:hypothetical protein